MALQFIFGSPGSGKSYHLHQNFVKEAMENPKQNYLLLVPEQFTMQTQKDLVLAHPNGGIMNIDVLSFGRLAHRIFEEVGGAARTVLDDEGKSLVLRKIAGDCEEELVVLKSNIKKPGYISEVKSVLSEFVQYDITEEHFDAMLEEAKNKGQLYYKLKDLRVLYDAFEEYLADKYITREELLEVLCQVIRKSEIIKNSVVALDGFTGFTPIQNKLLRELMKRCKKVIVTVAIDEKTDPYRYENPYQLFALSKQTVTRLVKIAGEEKVPVEEPVVLPSNPVYRFRGNEAMAFLEKHLFRYGKACFEKEQDTISVHVSKNPREEVDFVAQEIRRLVRKSGYRYREIAVIASDIGSYADYVEKAGEKYDIPVFMDHKRSILLNPFVEYIRSLIAMLEQNFSYESVFRFLRTGLTEFTMEEIDRLENYVIALGVKGYKKWQAPFLHRSNDMGEEELELLNGLRVRFVEKLDFLVSEMRRRNKTVSDITRALYDFLVKETMQEKVQEKELEFHVLSEVLLEKEYAQIYRIVMELFDKFVGLLGEEKVSLKEYGTLLDAGFAEAKVGIIPPGIDQVVVGDMERTRLKDVKALFFLGMNDAYLPGNQSQDGLLTERDRICLEAADVTLTPGPKEKIYIQKFYLYLNMTKPTEKLYLSYSKVSAGGGSLRPAYLVGDIKRMYSKLSVMDEEERPLLEKELNVKTGMDYLISGLKDTEETLSDEWKELYTIYKKEETYRIRLNNILDAVFYRRGREHLSETMARSIYGEAMESSVTRLEQFSACALSYFLRYGLKIRERQMYEFQAMDIGNVFHQALENFSRKLERIGETFVTVDEEKREVFIEESVEESIASYGNTVLYSTKRNEYMITRIKRMMRRTVWALTKQLEKGDFIPSGYEVSFAGGEHLGGKIDRIDTYKDDENVYVKVVDYKTGAKAFDLGELYYGLQMQLVLYMDAALKLEESKNPGKRAVPAGIFYYKMKDPLVEKEADAQKLEAMILKELKLDGIVNGAGDVIRHLEKEPEPSKASNVIPVEWKKDKTIGSRSKTITEQEFHMLFDYANKMKAQIRNQVRDGEAEARPFKLGAKTGCDFCPYKKICGFDPKLPGNEYRKMKKLKQDEALEKIEKEV